MSRPLIGQLLSRMGKLSRIDVDEILTQQRTTGQKFGEIAISWGLCDTDQLCEAWCAQLAWGAERVDLHEAGIDAHATHCIPRELAVRLQVIPIRQIADQVVVACSGDLGEEDLTELMTATQKNIRLVLADPQQIRSAIDIYYPARETSAA